MRIAALNLLEDAFSIIANNNLGIDRGFYELNNNRFAR
jgi:hypothetical protein